MPAANSSSGGGRRLPHADQAQDVACAVHLPERPELPAERRQTASSMRGAASASVGDSASARAVS